MFLNHTISENESWFLPQSILDLIFEMRNVLPDFHRQTGRRSHDGQIHIHKIRASISRNEPIRLILPAFPAKSPNSEKTLGPLPDLGEVLALRRLQRLCDSIAEIYQPGAQVIICSDGRVFSDLVYVPDPDVTIYSRGIQSILEREHLSSLTTFDLDDVMTARTTFDRMRDELVHNYAASIEQVRAQVIETTETKHLFNGIHRFLFEDLLVLRPDLSRSQVRQISKTSAYSVIQRSNAWSNLLEQQFPNAVRLSIHPQTPTSKKIGIRLLPSNDIWRTPWHSVVLYDGEQHQLVRRREAEAQGASLTSDANGIKYFAAAALGLNKKGFDYARELTNA